MKRKYADYPNWKRMEEKKYINKYFNNEDFNGYMSLLTAIKVREKLVVKDEEKDVIIIDDGYKWLEIYPENNKNIAISVALDDKDKIVEWYCDIAKNSDVTEDGIPYIDDLYLDVILNTNGKIKIVDEDELKEALENNEITTEDFELAYNVANNLIEDLNGKLEKLKEFTYKYLKYMQE